MRPQSPADIPEEVPEPEDVDIALVCAALIDSEKPDLIDFGPPAGREVW
jgi:hypothetical protein